MEGLPTYLGGRGGGDKSSDNVETTCHAEAVKVKCSGSG